MHLLYFCFSLWIPVYSQLSSFKLTSLLNHKWLQVYVHIWLPSSINPACAVGGTCRCGRITLLVSRQWTGRITLQWQKTVNVKDSSYKNILKKVNYDDGWWVDNFSLLSSSLKLNTESPFSFITVKSSVILSLTRCINFFTFLSWRLRLEFLRTMTDTLELLYPALCVNFWVSDSSSCSLSRVEWISMRNPL